MKLTLAIDVMGGDKAPLIVFEGLDLFLTSHTDVHFLLYGDAFRMSELLRQFPRVASFCTPVPTTEVVTSDTKPSAAIRGFKDSSMRQAIMAVREERAQAVVSAGNTGAYMALSRIVLGALPGIDRPAITALVPSERGPRVGLDLGANVEVSAENLVQFVIMGVAFARVVLGIASPSVGLLNVGSEEMKGGAALKEAHQLLKTLNLVENYHGFVEGDDIGKGTVDVFVTDGFTGNTSLKTMEGTARLLMHFLKEGVQKSFLSKIGALLARSALMHVRTKLDPRRYNGAPFLGVKGIAVKSHGGTDGQGFARAVEVAYDMARQDINTSIAAQVAVFSEQLNIARAQDAAMSEG